MSSVATTDNEADYYLKVGSYLLTEPRWGVGN